MKTTNEDEAFTPKSAGSMESGVSGLVAAVLEKEVNDHLSRIFAECIPEAFVLGFKGRVLSSAQIDSFAYMLCDSGKLGVSQKDHGIVVLVPDDCKEENSLAAPDDKLAGSPGTNSLVDSSGNPLEAEKYILGETYGGDKEIGVRRKVHQLENTILKMLDRRRQDAGWENLPDVTRVIGAAIFSFSTKSNLRRRKSMSKFRHWLLNEPSDDLEMYDRDGPNGYWINEELTPNLWRLAKARRVFLLVLSGEESGSSTAFRLLAERMDAIEESTRSVEESTRTNKLLLYAILAILLLSLLLK